MAQTAWIVTGLFLIVAANVATPMDSATTASEPLTGIGSRFVCRYIEPSNNDMER